MAKHTSRSGFVAKFGRQGQDAFDAHKDDETVYGVGGLPPGIEGGIAQLSNCKFDVYKSGDNQGEYYFYLEARVLQPKVFQTMSGSQNIEGGLVQLTEPLCETPDRSRPTFEDHVDFVLNELRKLGIETGETSFADLEAIVAALKEEQPCTRFRTWQGSATEQFPNPRVNHVFLGHCAHPEEEPDDVVDETGETPTDEGPVEDDLAALGEAADGQDEEAENRLVELAEQYGIDPESLEKWADVAAAIEEVQSGPTSQEESEPKEPEKGDVCNYKPPRARKSIECEVTAVFPGKQTCNLRSLDDQKSYRSVPWDKLEIPL